MDAVVVSYKDVLDDLRPAAAAAGEEEEDDDEGSDGDNDDDVVHDSTLPSHKVDEAPQDLDAFFVHPLTAATRSTSDGDALALLHEYRNLPVIDFHHSATGRYPILRTTSVLHLTPASSLGIFVLLCRIVVLDRRADFVRYSTN